ncbi:MAG: PIG-L family deacetylase [Eubacterium sp.]|uniref:PIG-L family deacetylase n=1 Tax=Eubacterium sp. TaxID=142586 RepID=UPI00300F7920
MKKNVKTKKKIAIVSTVIVIIAIVVATIMGTEYGKFLFIPSVKNKQLDELDLEKYNKLMIVAHPDDELIWGGAHLLEDDYLVVCITRGYDKTRKKEFENVIKATGDKGIILSYPDKIAGQRSDWGRWKKDIEKDIETIINYKNWDEIVTHNEKGEYGHIHHIMTHNIVDEACDKTGTGAKVMYFGKYYKKINLPETGLEKIDEDLLKQKDEISKLYPSQKKTIDKLHHMFPYENWTEKE